MPMPDYKAQCPIAVIIPVLFLAYKEAIVVVAKDNIAVVRDRDALQRSTFQQYRFQVLPLSGKRFFRQDRSL